MLCWPMQHKEDLMTIDPEDICSIESDGVLMMWTADGQETNVSELMGNPTKLKEAIQSTVISWIEISNKTSPAP